MAISVYFAKAKKKKNSTYQATFSTPISCVLKTPTSLNNPTFLVSAASMDYNLAKWDSRYYFVTDVRSVRADQWEVDCELDVLATAKSDILAMSNVFISYAQSGPASLFDSWLPDTRIPLTRQTDYAYKNDSSTNFDATGCYILTANSQDGCYQYILSAADLIALTSALNSWLVGLTGDITSGNWGGYSYSWASVEDAIKALAEMSTQSGLLGNAYANAPAQIKSCIWVPYHPAMIRESYLSTRLYLGTFDTGLDVWKAKISTQNYCTIDIPWRYPDWKRGVAEALTLYLPFVGTIAISTDDILTDTQIKATLAKASDGSVSYYVTGYPSGHVIGVYSGSCRVDIALGFNQQASAGEIFTSIASAIEKSVSTAVTGVASLSPIGIAGGLAGAGVNLAIGTYDTLNTMFSHNPTTIGSFGGCGVEFPLQLRLCRVANEFTASNLTTTMGAPVMKNGSLASVTGYVQLANAHLSSDLDAAEIDAIDAYLNSGFYIE